MNAGDAELLNYLISNMTQGGTAGNFAGGLTPPKAADVAAFKAASDPSDLQVGGDDTGQPGAFALQEVYNAGSTQQNDRVGQNVPGQDNDNNTKTAGTDEANSAKEKADAQKLDDAMKKQGEISSLISQIQQLQQQLQVIDSRGGASSGGQSSSLGDGFEQSLSKASPERTALVSLIQQLQQQLQVLLAS